ncbi:hypothetical protein N9410_00645 [Methylophilaceae bacterium]|jgi:hypothetical protein|nr:hypothetical protein [Methylophilaceae bacterium]|tara:strand:- start:209 stop:406 length:198 start_codon:yes stop_codon:yes gene_type:complete
MDLASLAATNIILITGLIVIVIILQRGFDILIKQQESVIYNLNCLRQDNRAMKEVLDTEGGKAIK